MRKTYTRTKPFEVSKCATCPETITITRHSKKFCSDCLKERLRKRDILPLQRQKMTRFYEFPDTISRSAEIRHNNKIKAFI